MAKLNGSEIVIECLKEQGVDTVFGYPGGAILNIYDALYKHPEIRHVLTSHEQGASHAADGYARSTGSVGVCFATSGPGATNLVTGIATAYMDSSPIVAITCNVTLPLLGKDSFQEVDITGITLPITKYSFIVKDVKKLAATIRRAFKIAKSGRPGPVLVDITKDVTAAVCDYVPREPEKIAPVNNFTDEDIEKALQLLKSAQKPCIIAGGGVVISGASEELAAFARKLQAPVCCTLMGQGALDQYDEHYMGMVGMHGTKAANFCVTESDLLIVIGGRFSDRWTGNTAKFGGGAKLLQIDIDDAEVNKNVRVMAQVTGDARTVLRKLIARMDPVRHEEWFEHAERMTDMYPLSYNKELLTGPWVIETIDRMTPDDTIIVTEVGQHQMWAAQYYKYKAPRTFISSGGLGTMGFGLGAAIGAQAANPDKVVINVAGDGCFRMNMNELATISREELPVIEVILNNHVLGMVRQWQNLYYGKRYSATVLNDKADFCKIAEGMGVDAYKVTTKEEFEKALEKALADRKPALIEVLIDQDDMVFPMCSPGAPLENTFDESDLKVKKDE
ncbi:MAG: biosynthetic-type acetolactate synthase large subunit [Stomatobaculum sp.]|nr:biosynthetic-type acetolactate synthase large subunit [Stomatobaculum sp.]MBR7057911.1 biosynthetic-type acetolactate synthase large subunit [Stomatobaculum sp.]